MLVPATNGSKLRIRDLENLRIMRNPEFRVMDRNEALKYRNHYMNTDRRVGFVGGVYDRFSDAHAKYLLKCMDACDILIVALDNDALARKRKKDPLRPWDKEEKRARIISWSGFAHIIVFRNEEEHPHDLLELLRPDVLFTSSTTQDISDEDREQLKQFCGEVVVFEPQSAEHTSDDFFRMEAHHTKNAARKMVQVVSEMIKPFGLEAVIRPIGEQQ